MFDLLCFAAAVVLVAGLARLARGEQKRRGRYLVGLLEAQSAAERRASLRKRRGGDVPREVAAKAAMR